MRHNQNSSSKKAAACRELPEVRLRVFVIIFTGTLVNPARGPAGASLSLKVPS